MALSRSPKDYHKLVAAFEAYLAAEKRYSPNTFRNYRFTLERFEDFAVGHRGGPVTLVDLGTWRTSDFRAFLAHRRQDGVTSQTINLDLSALRTFFKFLARETGMPTAALAALRSPKMPKRLPRPVPMDAAAALAALIKHRRSA